VQPILSFGKKIEGILYIIFGLPFYLFGLIHNILPYKLPAVISKAATKDVGYHAAMNLIFGIFTFLSFYIAYGFAYAHFIPTIWYLLAYLLFAALSGFFAYRYWYFLLDVIGRWRIANLSKSPDFQSLLDLRKTIIEDLEVAKNEYLESLATNMP
jgi:hypothetical protein